jgi:hypothetical protein
MLAHREAYLQCHLTVYCGRKKLTMSARIQPNELIAHISPLIPRICHRRILMGSSWGALRRTRAGLRGSFAYVLHVPARLLRLPRIGQASAGIASPQDA